MILTYEKYQKKSTNGSSVSGSLISLFLIKSSLISNNSFQNLLMKRFEVVDGFFLKMLWKLSSKKSEISFFQLKVQSASAKL